jgi:hypothetical protein
MIRIRSPALGRALPVGASLAAMFLLTGAVSVLCSGDLALGAMKSLAKPDDSRT